MSITINHTSTFPSAIHKGFQINPLAGGLVRSPCACRPDTGEPCKLLKVEKNNPYCEACALLGKGDCWDPGNFVPKPIERSDKRYHNCGFRDCTKQTKGKYCKKHTNLVNSRKKSWERDHVQEPYTIEWLHRPVDKDMVRRGQGRKFKK